MALLFLLVGVIVEIVENIVIGEDAVMGYIFPTGALFIVLISLFPAQTIMIYGLTGISLSSGKRRKLLLDYPTICNTVVTIVSYTLVVLLRGIASYLHPEIKGYMGLGLMIVGFLVIVFQIYSALAYKSFVISMILFFTIYFPCVFYFSGDGEKLYHTFNKWMEIPFGIQAGIGYIMLCIGLVLYYIVSRLLYRVPIDKYVYRSFAKKTA